MAAERDEDRSVCTPCRGSGQVISNLGGSPHQLSCPWCGGTGRFQLGRDAQTGETAVNAPSVDD
jgi:DnaJ-class molecular chaperone